MKVLISGMSGLVGSALAESLRSGGHEVDGLSRSAPAGNGAVHRWQPEAGELDSGAVAGFDAVVHLAGENIAAKRWNAALKGRIRDSRVQGTRLLCGTLARLLVPPRVLVAASAIGLYGDRATEELVETSPAGSGFLADVCRDWEAATEPAARAGIRVVNLRIGVVLSREGGALAKMLPPFRMGVGGQLGDGRQYMSWIAIDDVVGAIGHALATEGLDGPVNATAPCPVTNHDFTKTLGHVLGRPTIFPVPGFAARLAFGEMANDLLLASIRALPARLLATGFQFRFVDLDSALRHLLARR